MATPFPICLEGKSIPPQGVLTSVFKLTNEYAFATIQINAVNDSGVNSADIQIAISPAGTPDGVSRIDYIEALDRLSPYGRYTNFGVLLPANCSVFVKSNTPDVVFRVTALAHINI